MEERMTHDVALTGKLNDEACGHLLQHYNQRVEQEDLCFATWRPSTGASRHTAIIDQLILPEDGDRHLHGNASFEPRYLRRAIATAREQDAGLAFMHSHPGEGWQGLSDVDARTERKVIAFPSGATHFPLVGLTVGSDGYWSGRVWQHSGGRMHPQPCDKVRVVGPHEYRAFFDDCAVPLPRRSKSLQRTYETFGTRVQNDLSRLRIGIVGLGSVGSMVAEIIGRIGVSRITLIDHDVVQTHNLDRMVHATRADAKRREKKVVLAERHLRQYGTATNLAVQVVAAPIQNRDAYDAALDCDVLFSCVDRPVARDVLNHIAYAHLIPVVDGGIAVVARDEQFRSAHWRAHLIAPDRQCMRCNLQYTTADVTAERDGSLDDPSYVQGLPEHMRTQANVFPFSVQVASMEVNLLLHYLLKRRGWRDIYQQDYHFQLGKLRTLRGSCRGSCRFPHRVGRGDSVTPHYVDQPSPAVPRREQSRIHQWRRHLGRLIRLARM